MEINFAPDVPTSRHLNLSIRDRREDITWIDFQNPLQRLQSIDA